MELLQETKEEKKNLEIAPNPFIAIKGEVAPDGLNLMVELNGLHIHEALGILELAKANVMDRAKREDYKPETA